MKLPVPTHITPEAVARYGAPCATGLRYFERQAALHGRVCCDRETLERVLAGHPGCIAWLLTKIAMRFTTHQLGGPTAVKAFRALEELGDDISRETERCVAATGIWSRYNVPVDVWSAVFMMCYLAHKDELRGIALDYFNIPGAVDPKARPEGSNS